MPKEKATKKKGKKKGVAEKIGEKAEGVVQGVAEDLGKEIGKVTHYFDKIGVAVVELAKSLGVGDLIRIKGSTTDFIQKIESMQAEHKPVKKAKKGDAIGMKVKDRVRLNDKVYLQKK